MSAGVIDRDFRGEVKVLVHNQSGREFLVRTGDSIAQLIVEKVMEVEVNQVETLSEAARGVRGLGSTGLERPGDETSVAMRSVRSLLESPRELRYHTSGEKWTKDEHYIFPELLIQPEIFDQSELFDTTGLYVSSFFGAFDESII